MFLISHRGNNNHGYKENTMDALITSYNTSYIDGIEFDIRLTKDNVIVISHDGIVNGMIINRTNYRRLKQLVKLEDILIELSDKKKILIEIKEDNIKIVDLLYNILKKYNYNFYICSFNYKIVNMFKNKYNNYKVGLIIGYMINLDNIYNIFDFNLLQYNLIKRINKTREVFIWTVNDKKIIDKININDVNIITDKSYLFR